MSNYIKLENRISKLENIVFEDETGKWEIEDYFFDTFEPMCKTYINKFHSIRRSIGKLPLDKLKEKFDNLKDKFQSELDTAFKLTSNRGGHFISQYRGRMNDVNNAALKCRDSLEVEEKSQEIGLLDKEMEPKFWVSVTVNRILKKRELFATIKDMAEFIYNEYNNKNYFTNPEFRFGSIEDDFGKSYNEYSTFKKASVIETTLKKKIKQYYPDKV